MTFKVLLVGEVEDYKMRFVKGVTGTDVTGNYLEPTKYVKKSDRVKHNTIDVEKIKFQYSGTEFEIFYIHRKNDIGRLYYEDKGYPVIHVFASKRNLEMELRDADFSEKNGRKNTRVFIGLNMDHDIDLTEIEKHGFKFYEFYQTNVRKPFDYLLTGPDQVRVRSPVKIEKDVDPIEEFVKKENLEAIADFSKRYSHKEIESIEKFLKLSLTDRTSILETISFQ